jgi:hypothetical protein
MPGRRGHCGTPCRQRVQQALTLVLPVWQASSSSVTPSWRSPASTPCCLVVIIGDLTKGAYTSCFVWHVQPVLSLLQHLPRATAADRGCC